MKASVRPRVVTRDLPVIEKSATGIDGLDEITFGGLPKGRPTLLCGSAGCGKRLIADKKIAIDHIHLDRNEIEEAGDYDLDGLFIRIGFAIDAIGAKRVVI